VPSTPAETIVHRLAAATRAAALYHAGHPLVAQTVTALADTCELMLRRGPSVVIGFLADQIVVDTERLPPSPGLAGFRRQLKDRGVERIAFAKGVTLEELQVLVSALASRHGESIDVELKAHHAYRVTVGVITPEEGDDQRIGMATAQRMYHRSVSAAQALWGAAEAGETPDPTAARAIIDNLARTVTEDRTSLMALTTLKRYDNYTFTHMVNVSILTMAVGRSLNLDDPMLREFGLAALMHDIGKAKTPTEILNKPDRLTSDEFKVMKRHVVDGAHMLRRTPDMPALAPVVAFEHHLKQDLSGYPENVGARSLNLCTMIVSITDVFDALRSHRPYRAGMATDRVRTLLTDQTNPAFEPTLLRRFITLIGLHPVGTLVRLTTDEVAVVTHEHPTDPFRPQVKIIMDARGERLPEPSLVNTWERDDRGEQSRAVVESVDPELLGLDPLTLL
jgi:putative nucleotidyltransferase with HDIG domain